MPRFFSRFPASPGDSPRGLAGSLVLLLLLSGGCSLKKRAVNSLAEVMGEAEAVYLSDEDPELIREALPFNLKTLETLLISAPRHRGLLLSTTKAFLLYTWGFVEPEGERMEEVDFRRATEIRRRAARLYRRAYRYGIRGLEVKHPGIGAELSLRPVEAAARLEKEDVPLAVWAAAALGAAISVSTEEAESTADIAVVGALLERALSLEPDYEKGTIYEFLVRYEAQRVGGSEEKARQYFERAQALSQGRRCGLWLTWAESFSIPRQDRREFEEFLDRVLNFDLDSAPENRLLNTLAQRRARWLKGRLEELFLPELPSLEGGVDPQEGGPL